MLARCRTVIVQETGDFSQTSCAFQVNKVGFRIATGLLHRTDTFLSSRVIVCEPLGVRSHTQDYPLLACSCRWMVSCSPMEARVCAWRRHTEDKCVKPRVSCCRLLRRQSDRSRAEQSKTRQTKASSSTLNTVPHSCPGLSLVLIARVRELHRQPI